ncbi:uncharacterized protein PHACADRAFT_257433 [Phanerochaete carnosa HHB-10118-sp]|uniref:Uncharacterized protein n=1 Tax=Phanerochaete carnosa (strain HHB-10118-sp) TaxID=650164 RepID=K5UVA2_PHACS|nr:uncharacterized protein PHACADRAFT_257433 [Phanerochaete carnosa HHB-10118-sp]EKM53926.1 hypothetical protein PHACADRAFT_257433 [Phanerochaete carnosa HHB-10118-sp]
MCHVTFWLAEHDPLVPLSCYIDTVRNANDDHGWMAISWVCRRWRAVVLNAPVLWTNIHVTDPMEPVKAYLERSQDMPLSILGKLRFKKEDKIQRIAGPDT